jgi:hypothetical protein
MGQSHGSDVERRLERLNYLARMLDSALRIPGTNIRFGADAALDLIPVIGNIVTTAMAGYIILEAYRLRLPNHVIARMIGNVAFDAVVSAVPIFGNIADVFFRANRRNVRLIARHLGNALDNRGLARRVLD